MSRFSGKCDFYDNIHIHGLDHFYREMLQKEIERMRGAQD